MISCLREILRRPKGRLMCAILFFLLTVASRTLVCLDGLLPKAGSKEIRSPSSTSIESPLLEIGDNNNTTRIQSLDDRAWMTPYLESFALNDSDMQGRILEWTCLRRGACGGTGDRIFGIVQVFTMAICTNRRFRVDNLDSIPHGFTLNPIFQVYADPTDKRSHKTIDTIDNRQSAYLLDPLQLPTNVSVVTLAANLYMGDDLVAKSACMQAYWKNHFNQEEQNQFTANEDPFYLLRSAFWTLFSWNHTAVTNRVTQLATTAGLAVLPAKSNATLADPTAGVAIPDLYIGVHIRTGMGTTWSDPPRHNDPDDWKLFLECAKRLQKALATKCFSDNDNANDIPIYVAADNPAPKQLLADLDPVTVKTIPNLELFHVDKSRLVEVQNVMDASFAVPAELRLLTQATCVVQSRSKFSVLAEALSYQVPRCAILYDECHDEERLEGVLAGVACP